MIDFPDDRQQANREKRHEKKAEDSLWNLLLSFFLGQNRLSFDRSIPPKYSYSLVVILSDKSHYHFQISNDFKTFDQSLLSVYPIGFSGQVIIYLFIRMQNLLIGSLPTPDNPGKDYGHSPTLDIAGTAAVSLGHGSQLVDCLIEVRCLGLDHRYLPKQIRNAVFNGILLIHIMFLQNIIWQVREADRFFINESRPAFLTRPFARFG